MQKSASRKNIARIFLHWWPALSPFSLNNFGEKKMSWYEPGTLRLSNHTNAEHFFGFFLKMFHQAGHNKAYTAWLLRKINLKCLFMDPTINCQFSNASLCPWEGHFTLISHWVPAVCSLRCPSRWKTRKQKPNKCSALVWLGRRWKWVDYRKRVFNEQH